MGHLGSSLLRRYADTILLNMSRFYCYIPGKWMDFYWKDEKDQASHFYTPNPNVKPTELSPSYTYAAERQVMRTMYGPHFR